MDILFAKPLPAEVRSGVSTWKSGGKVELGAKHAGAVAAVAKLQPTRAIW